MAWPSQTLVFWPQVPGVPKLMAGTVSPAVTTAALVKAKLAGPFESWLAVAPASAVPLKLTPSTKRLRSVVEEPP